MALNFPNTPVDGELWTDPSNNAEYVYVATTNHWRINGSLGSGGDGGTEIGPTPPVSPEEGKFWFNPVNGILYTWYIDPDGDAQWVDVRPGGGSGGISAISTNNPITGDGTVAAPVDFDINSLNALP